MSKRLLDVLIVGAGPAGLGVSILLKHYLGIKNQLVVDRYGVLAGPAVRHDHHVFCFIYKFRQRFAVIARAVGSRLGVDVAPLESLRTQGMFLDDLSCCGTECVC